MLSHFRQALTYAETVSDRVLDKVHPNIRSHWREELEQGLRERIKNFESGDVRAEIKGSALRSRSSGANLRDRPTRT